MRLFSQLLVVLTVCLVAIALPAAPAQANGGGPSITLSPSSGVPGEEITVSGNNFTAGEWVDIYYYLDTTNTTDRILVEETKVLSTRRFTVTFAIPESCKGAHKVRVEEDSSYAYVVEAYFTVKPGLTASPAEGLVGTNVTVEGHGFAKSEKNIELRYYLNGNYTTIAQNIPAGTRGDWTWSFEIPSSAKGDHSIDAKGDSSSFVAVKDAIFEVTPGISLGKLSGTPGEKIMMTGNGFYANDRYITILFAGEEVNTDVRVDANPKGYWEKDFAVPEMPKGTYSVTAYGESTPKEDISVLSFNITPGLVLSPDEGHVGTDLTVTGHGFATNKDVVVKYDGSQKATAMTDNEGSFHNVSFPVPESQHGENHVTAEDAASNNATAIFTMESTPPGTPELISPLDKSRVGFIRVRPTFEWSMVLDDSGVRYNLQIARSNNVTATGFANPLVLKPNIVVTNYTLEKPLSYGTYYWIVQAVDGAGNTGNWTEPISFRAGLLPLWAFIVIIVAIVAGVGAAVYFFIFRKRIHYY